MKEVIIFVGGLAVMAVIVATLVFMFASVFTQVFP